MKKKSMFFCAVISLLFGSLAYSAEIIWLDPIEVDLPLVQGEVLEAINLGGPAIENVGGVNFSAGDGNADAPVYSNMFDYLVTPWAGPTGAGDFVDDPGLADVISTVRYVGTTATQEMQLQNLTPGTTYMIQIYGGDQRDCCSARGYHFEDGLGNSSPVWTRGALTSLVGQFTADAETQYLSMVCESGSQDPQLTAYVLSIASPPTSATRPFPANDANDVLRDSVLTWTPSQYAATHDLYIGTSYDEVDAATTPTAAGLDVNSFDPGRLAFDQTYYWRIDEVNGAPDYTVFTGPVWSFVAESHSIMIPGNTITASSSSNSNESSIVERLIDGSGMNGDAHAIAGETMWFSAEEAGAWVQFEFPDIKMLDIIKIWNSNTSTESFLGWGVKDVDVLYSVDGENWDLLVTTQLTKATGKPTYSAYDTIDFQAVPAKYVRLDIQNNWGGFLQSYSLSEVQFYMIPAQARSPIPEDGAIDVLPDGIATWRAGRQAGTHTVYMDIDVNAVAEGTVGSVELNTNSYDLLQQNLLLDETYAWRVDEVNDVEATTVWAGPVWQFSTPAALVIDDFDGYGNLSPNRAFQAWKDGAGYTSDDYFPNGYSGNGTGSAIGHDIWNTISDYYEKTIMDVDRKVAGSEQSMPLYYSNDGSQASEINLEFDTPQDWTKHDIQVLSLWVFGQSDNTGELYIKIGSQKVTYTERTNRPVWQLWNIDLSTVNNVSNVSSLSIGVDGYNATGMFLIDDILLERQMRDYRTGLTSGEDVVLGFPNDGLTTGDAWGWPEAEAPAMAIDDNTGTKLLHFKGDTEPAGIQVTPQVGATIVTEIKFTTANDVPARDPVSFELSGSNTGIDGPYTVIASGDIVDFMQETEWPRFTENETPITFDNTVSYKHYQILVTGVRDADTANCMQLSEIELYGTIVE